MNITLLYQFNQFPLNITLTYFMILNFHIFLLLIEYQLILLNLLILQSIQFYLQITNFKSVIFFLIKSLVLLILYFLFCLTFLFQVMFRNIIKLVKVIQEELTFISIYLWFQYFLINFLGYLQQFKQLFDILN